MKFNDFIANVLSPGIDTTDVEVKVLDSDDTTVREISHTYFHDEQGATSVLFLCLKEPTEV